MYLHYQIPPEEVLSDWVKVTQQKKKFRSSSNKLVSAILKTILKSFLSITQSYFRLKFQC